METRSRRSGEENARLKQHLTRDAEDGRAVIDRQAAMIDEMRRRLETRAPAPVPAAEQPRAWVTFQTETEAAPLPAGRRPHRRRP